MTRECLFPVIFHGLCFEFGAGVLESEPYCSPGHVFFRASTLWSVAALMTVHCARVSELLEQPVNATFHPSFVRNSVLNCLALYPFK